MSRTPEEIPELALDDSLRDGILEEDNLIPAWFNWSWIASWIFGVGYILFYLVLSSWSSADQYRAEAAVADAQLAKLAAARPKTNPYRGDPAAIGAGSQVYASTCVACHLPSGVGLVGPSLVDPYFKYGSDDAALFTTVNAGRPEGMPPWGPMLGAEKIWQVLAYIDTLPKSDAPGIGAPGYQPAAP